MILFADDVQQLAALQLLAGYIKLLGFKRMPHLLSSASHLNRLMLTLIQAFELEYSFVSLLEDYSLRGIHCCILFIVVHMQEACCHIKCRRTHCNIIAIINLTGCIVTPGTYTVVCQAFTFSHEL